MTHTEIVETFFDYYQVAGKGLYGGQFKVSNALFNSPFYARVSFTTEMINKWLLEALPPLQF